MNNQNEEFVSALGNNRFTRFYDPMVRYTTRETRFKKQIVQCAKIQEGERVVDFGCGTGTLLLKLHEKYPNAEFFGVDIDLDVLDQARTKDSSKSLNLENSPSSNTPFPDDFFDHALSTLLFHHLSHEEKLRTLSEIRRVLKPNCYFYYADYGLPSGKLQSALSKIIVQVDGDETTSDNLEGRVPKLIFEAGFAEYRAPIRINTMLGTICILILEKK